MKTIKLTLIFYLFAYCGISQTDESNLKKYWKFRDQFVEDFVKIGSSYGESLPAGARKPCFCIDNDGDN